MNVVLIVMDTARARTTFELFRDNKDKNASHSISDYSQFTQAFSSAPWTLPSHASLFTGTTPSKHGAHAGHKQLDNALITLPEIVQREGYETVAVSNNTWISEEFGFGSGFETFYKTWQYVQSNTDLGRIARQEEGLDKLTEATKALFDGNPLTNLTNAIYGQFFRKIDDDGATRSNAWINNWLTSRDNSRPFFLFINYLEPHLEYRPLKSHAKEHLPEGISYEEAMEVSQDAWGYIAGTVEITDTDFEILRALYRAEISYVEEQIEEIVHLLKAENEWEETLFIITSDHGENIGDHGLMDHQYALYDTLLHVPLLINGGPFEKTINDDFIQLLDIAPTVLDVLDIEAPNAQEQFQGVSFHPDAEDTREFAVAEYRIPQPSMEALQNRVGDLPDSVYTYNRSLRSIRTHEYKYIRGSDGSQQLYDLASDPHENANLADTHPDVIADFDTKLNDWIYSFEHADPSSEVRMADDTKSRLEDLGYLQ